MVSRNFISMMSTDYVPNSHIIILQKKNETVDSSTSVTNTVPQEHAASASSSSWQNLGNNSQKLCINVAVLLINNFLNLDGADSIPIRDKTLLNLERELSRLRSLVKQQEISLQKRSEAINAANHEIASLKVALKNTKLTHEGRLKSLQV